MIEIKRRGTKRLTFTAPSTPTAVTITLTHEFGDSIRAATPAGGSGVSWYYDLTPDDTESCGSIRATWTYTIGGVTKKRVDHFRVFQPYVTEATLLMEYPELDGKTDNFTQIERQVRQVIDTYCGQTFDAYPGRILKIDGSGTNMLHVWYRVEELTNVYVDGDTNNDVVAYVEIAPDSDFYIRKKNSGSGGNKSEAFERMFGATEHSNRFFNKRRVYHVKGDFGWGYVPSNVEEASKLLIQDWYNQDSTHRRHGIIFSGVGPVQNNYQTDLIGTTGNIDADVLLMDYTKFVMDYI